jgi:hypothetical protein
MQTAFPEVFGDDPGPADLCIYTLQEILDIASLIGDVYITGIVIPVIDDGVFVYIFENIPCDMSSFGQSPPKVHNGSGTCRYDANTGHIVPEYGHIH